MNQRINELLRAATLTERSHGAFGEAESYEKLDPKKFAELIIADCMRISNESGSSTMIADRIAEHFGLPYGLR